MSYREANWQKMNELVTFNSDYDIGYGNPNREYVAYSEGNGPVTIDLSGIFGSFKVTYFNPFKAKYFRKMKW